MKEIKRFDEIDILKSLGIILMIMGHINFGGGFNYWIHSFHMPMFYIISGFLYKKSNLSLTEFLRKKSKTLLFPYFIFALFHLIVWYILLTLLNKEISFLSIESIFFINTDHMPISGALWFLTSLFFVDLFYYCIDKLSKEKIKILIIVFMALFGCIIPNYFRLPWALDTALMGVGLYFIGIVFKRIYHQNANISIAIFIFIFGSVLTFINGYINVREGSYSNILLYYFVASMMTFSLFCFASRLKQYHCKIIEELKFIGRNSIIYVCLNQIVLLFFNKIGLIFSHSLLVYITYKVIILFITLLILHIFVLIFNTKSFKWIIGK